MNYFKFFITLFLVSISTLNFAQEKATFTGKHIEPNSDNIQVYGSNFIKMEGDEMILHRHSDEVYAGTTKSNLFNPLKARTGTGIYIEFKTKSPSVTVKLKTAKGNPKHAFFNVFQDGEFDKDENFKYVEDAEIKIELYSKYQGKAVVYRITFPLMTDIHFLGLELEKNAKLCKLKKEEKRVYVAFGDSVTHGTGQKNTSETFAYQLAEKMDYELFNIAVGGAKTSTVMAKMISDDFKKIDMITVLIGFNDYNGKGISTEEYSKRYTNVLNILREKHPDTKIYCISMTYTTQNNSKISQIPADDFRKVVREVVAKRQNNGDKNLFLIKGKDITNETSLKDKVHFSIQGAKNFAEALYQEINRYN